MVVRDEPPSIPTVVRLSCRARALVVQNLVIAGVFITGPVVWDLAGTLPLPLSAAGHEGSAVIVGLNGLRSWYPGPAVGRGSGRQEAGGREWS